MLPQHASAEPPTDATSASFSTKLTATQFVALLFGYFALHTILRGLISEAAGIDDCDQIIRTQIWSWGYGPQPPLYTWLLKIFLSVFGYNVFSVTALKELLLFGIYVFAYINTRLITRSHVCGVAAAIAVQFSPSISWESHRELTHSIMASFFVMTTIYSFLKLRSGEWKYYLVLALSIVGGTFSKYNYLIFLAATLSAGISIRELRSAVLSRKMLVALLLATLLCAPHANWIYQHRELAFSSMHKFKITETQTWFAAMAKALPKWILDLLAHLGPMLAIFALVFSRAITQARCRTPDDQFMWRTLLWILGIVTASILLFKVTGFRDRWLQPLFAWVPILLVAAWRDYLSAGRYRAIAILGVAIGVIVLVLAPGRLLLTERLKKNEVLNIPYRQLAADLRPQLSDNTTIVVGDYRVAGNLRLWFPNNLITSPEFAGLFPPTTNSAVLVWDSSTDPQLPKEAAAFAKRFTGKVPAQGSTEISETLKYHHDRKMKLSIATLE